MTIHNLKECHMLEGTSNFIPWECKVENLLEKFDLWGFVDTRVAKPINPTQLEKYNKLSKVTT